MGKGRLPHGRGWFWKCLGLSGDDNIGQGYIWELLWI